MATKTFSTVVALFQNEADARSASDDLRANGFSSDDIFITSDNTRFDQQEMVDQRYEHHEGGIKGWFKSLFGQENDEDRSYYESAVSKGNVCLTVDVTDQNMDRAADILNRHSPVEIQKDEGGTGVTANAYGSSRGGVATDATSATGAAANTRDTAAKAGSTRAKSAQESGSIPVVREELKIGKRAVLRGGVRVYSRMVEEPVEESVRLREEKVRVERAPVNRDTTDADMRRGQEQVVEVKEYAEEPVVSKQARVVEEVRIQKDASERTEVVRDTVRHTEVNVENLSGAASTAASNLQNTAERTGRSVGTAESGVNAADYTATSGAAVGTQRAYDQDFRRDYEQRYAATGESYDIYGPGYEYGYTMASDPRYQGRSFDDIESDLRQDYGRLYPNSTWEKIKDSVRYGWDRVTHPTRQ